MSTAADALCGRRPLIVRRRRPDDSFLQAIVAAGAQPLVMPVMRIVPLLLDAENTPAAIVFNHLDDYSAAVFTSPVAVELMLVELRRRGLTFPRSWRFFAVGDATAQPLRAVGLEVVAPARDMTSEGVLVLPELQSLHDERIAIFRGEGGRRVMDQAFRQRGAHVTSCPLYRRERDTQHLAELSKAIQDDTFDAVVVHSGELLDMLGQLLSRDEFISLMTHPVVVPAPRVAEKARRMGGQQVYSAENATADAIVSALAECYSC